MTIPSQTQAASGHKIPPKLQQLLAILPEVDKVNLLLIAREYDMDLDDPGFLPLLLTKDGIAALKAATKELSEESGKTVSYMLSRTCAAINETATAEKESLGRLKEESELHIKTLFSDGESAFKSSLEKWSEETLTQSIAGALVDNTLKATNVAKDMGIVAANEFKAVADDAAKEFKKAANDAAVECGKTAEAAKDAVSQIRLAFVCSIFIAGLVLGLLSGIYMHTPQASAVHLDTDKVANLVAAVCKKR